VYFVSQTVMSELDNTNKVMFHYSAMLILQNEVTTKSTPGILFLNLNGNKRLFEHFPCVV